LTNFTSASSRLCNRRERIRAMTRTRAAAALVLALFLCTCGLFAADKPSLVVVISVDQMRADYLDRFRPYFGKDGFNRFLEHGPVYAEAHYRHPSTSPGPGHASIGTGLDPRDHGIIANLWYNRLSGREIYCVEDNRVEWVGAPSDAKPIPILPASPIFLEGVALGDRLKEKFPQARVVGIALKDRAAVLMAGRKADAALWFEERFARFVTSTYYPLRSSLLAFDERLPAFFALPEHRTWTLSNRIPAADLARITVDPPELIDAKGQPESYKPTFDHTLGDPKAILSSPWGDVLMLDLARFVIEDFRLGAAADHPDLLFIGLSSTDYYGHWFGPDSKEIADGIVRLDQTLEQFFGWLDSKVGRDKPLVFLTADHGVQSIPEVARAKQKQKTGLDDYLSAGRVDFSNSRGGVQTPTMRQLGGDRFTLEFYLAKTFGYEIDLDAAAAAE